MFTFYSTGSHFLSNEPTKTVCLPNSDNTSKHKTAVIQVRYLANNTTMFHPPFSSEMHVPIKVMDMATVFKSSH